MGDKWILTNGKDKYIRYKHYMENERPETWGQALIESNYLLATRYSSWEQADKERKRLKKVARGFHVANENEKSVRSNQKRNSVVINNTIEQNTNIANIESVVIDNQMFLSNNFTADTDKRKKKNKNMLKLFSVAITEYDEEEEKEIFSERNKTDEYKGKNKEKNPNRRCFTHEERVKVYRKNEGHCYLCGDFLDFDEFEIDHFKPLSKKPDDDTSDWNDIENLNVICHKCNCMKSNLWFDEFIVQMEKIQANLQI